MAETAITAAPIPRLSISTVPALSLCTDIERRTEDKHCLYGAGHVLDLAVTEAVLVIGRLAGLPDRKPGNYRRYEVNPGMHCFGDNTDGLHHDTDDQLQDDQCRIRKD
jgi:hypothetical protein